MTNKEKLQEIRYALNLFLSTYESEGRDADNNSCVFYAEKAIEYLNDLIVEESLKSNGTNEIPY